MARSKSEASLQAFRTPAQARPEPRNAVGPGPSQIEQDRRFDGIEKSLAALEFAVLSGGPLILALLVKLVFFP